MKKIILTISLITIVNINYAQVHISGYGLKAGINMYKFTNSSLAALKNLSSLNGFSMHNAYNIGINFGGVLQVALTNKLMIQPQLLYSQMGSKITLSQSLNATITHKLNYLSIPVTLKYNFANNISVFAGPQMSFLLGAKRNFVENNMGTIITSNININDKIKPIDFAGLVGIEYTLPKQGVFFSAGFQISLTDIAKIKTKAEGEIDLTKDAFLFDPLKLSAFNFTVGYIMKHKKYHKTFKENKKSNSKKLR